MRRVGFRTKVVGVLAATLVLSALLMPGVRAQKVHTPGSFVINPTGGFLMMRNTFFDLTPNPLPECSDIFDNDGDTKVDLLDKQCVAGPAGQAASTDDSELVAGYQTKQNFRMEGSITAAGMVTVPKASVQFPRIYIPIQNPVSGETAIVTANVEATHDATGTLNPLTGDTELRVRIRLLLSGLVFGIGLGETCSIGTANNPIDLNVLTTGLSNPPAGTPSVIGSRYNPSTGGLRLVNNSFAVPGASGCPIGLVNVNQAINQAVQIPSPAGSNEAQLSGLISPAPQGALTAVIGTDPDPLTGPAPLTVTFNSSGSLVKKGPATYKWELFPNFSQTPSKTATGPTFTETIATSGFQQIRLTVTDADGDSAVSTRAFFVSEPSGPTTTTTAPPTTTTSTTKAPTTTTTTTAPPTTTTSTTKAPTTTTTTTAPPTTTTSTTKAPTTTTTTTRPPTTTTTTTKAPTTTTTTTTRPPTTTTTTTKAPTTTTTTTTRPPTTTTTTTKAPTTTTTTPPTTTPSRNRDHVMIAIGGGFDYQVDTDLTSGDIRVMRSGDDIRGIVGTGKIVGESGKAAHVKVNLRRMWMLDLWVGHIIIQDEEAGVNHRIPFVGPVEVDGDKVTGSGVWASLGTFPNLIQPMTIDWAFEDNAGR